MSGFSGLIIVDGFGFCWLMGAEGLVGLELIEVVGLLIQGSWLFVVDWLMGKYELSTNILAQGWMVLMYQRSGLI